MREEKEKNVCANKEGMIEYDHLTACKSKAIEESLNQTGVVYISLMSEEERRASKFPIRSWWAHHSLERLC